MATPCVILEISGVDDWGTHPSGGRLIPAGGASKVLHPSREVADAEALRLAANNPSKHFAVFEAAVLAQVVRVPSHITVSGKVWMTREQAILVEIDDSEVPF